METTEYQRTNMTLACDASSKPVGLLPLKHVVGRLAAATIDGSDDHAANVQILLQDEKRTFRSKYLEIAAPLIVMFPSYIELSHNESAYVSRRVLFARDEWTCQYCGFIAPPRSAIKELTLDHVKPARLFSSRGEATTWENVTTACRSCNIKKGGQLPREARMMPKRTPRQPNYVQIRFAGRLSAEQRNYVIQYYGEKVAKHL